MFGFFSSGQTQLKDISELNFIIGKEFANSIKTFISECGYKAEDIDLIGSHGQTIWHNVLDNMDVTSTLQIGDISVISCETGITCIGDFRAADVAVSGNGAPLTSTLDYLLMRPPYGESRWRALQNIGGIGNVTFVSSRDNDIIAFDTGPGNVLLDWFISKITHNEKSYDKDGEFARTGIINESLLNDMLRLPYFNIPPPKTTGRELFTFQLGELWLKEAKEKYDISDADFACTLTELTAISITDSYRRFSKGQIYEVVLSGGGANNLFLTERILKNLETLGDIHLRKHDDLGISSESKEGVLFALLGYLTLNGIYGNIPSCTGANNHAILGKIAPGKNYKKLLLSQDV